MLNVSKMGFLQRIPISTSVLTTRTKLSKTMENNTKREPLRLVDGKFMRGGVVVAPVIGDREQIALLQAEERAAEGRERRAKRGTLDIAFDIENIEYSACLQLKCICGYTIYKTDRRHAYDCFDLKSDTWGYDLITCPKCRRRYEINDDTAKLIKE